MPVPVHCGCRAPDALPAGRERRDRDPAIAWSGQRCVIPLLQVRSVVVSLSVAGGEAEIARAADLLEPGAEPEGQEVGLFVARQQEVPAGAGVLAQPARDDEKLVQHLWLDLAAGGPGIAASLPEEAPGGFQRELRVAQALSLCGALLHEAAAGEQEELHVSRPPRRTGCDDVQGVDGAQQGLLAPGQAVQRSQRV